MNRDWLTWSNVVWAIFIFVIFMGLELSGYFRIVPWRTLSETVWGDEAQYHVLYFVVGSFLCGLTVHFLSRVPLWHAMLIGIAVGVISHLISGWPKW